MLTTGHVLFHSDREENILYMFHEESGGTKWKVLFMGEAAHCDAINAAIGAKGQVG